MRERTELIECGRCRHTDKASAFAQGRGRPYGQHPDHRYCPSCRGSIEWYGYRRVRPAVRRRRVAA